jgi:peptidoglycan lytic transglycosylase D
MFSVKKSLITAPEKQQYAKTVIATLPVFLLVSLLFFFISAATPAVAAKHFPRYPVIEKNVRFWEAIYDTYSTSQAVVHDSNNLAIVYEVIPIFNHRLPGSSKINKPIFKGIKNKYRNILNRLAQGAKPRNKEERRVLALFGKTSRKQLRHAAGTVRIQIGQKDRFIEGVIRSGAYITQIKKIFKQQGLPQDLAYLPHVESSFDLRAYSKFGASGIWQFTRSTGKQFLTINYVVDERQDPILASHAAATFLKKNYNSLKSWPLAITAYNYGPAGMRRAQKAHGSYEKIFQNYQQGHFKFASRNFYSEFLAAVKIAKKLEREPTLKLRRPQQSLRVTLPAFVAAHDISKHFQISIANIKKFNPALRRPVLQGKKYIPKEYILHLPNNSKQRQLLTSVPSHFYHNKQKPTQFYRVRKGDTAGGIANKFKISLRSLRQANNLNKNATIFVGQNLRVPGQAKGQQSQKRFSQTHQKANKRQAASSSIPLLSDTKKHKPTWKKIQTARSVILGELSVRKIEQKTNLRQGTITVLPEESVELLADWLQVNPSAIRKLNAFTVSRVLHPDESILIPLNSIQAKTFEEKRFDFHLETEEDFFDTYKIVGVHSYTVQKGDTVWEICRKKFDLPLWLLKKYNTNLDFSSLQSSQQLTIPIVKTI